MGFIGDILGLVFNVGNAVNQKKQYDAMQKLAKEQGAVAARQRERSGAEQLGSLELGMAASGIEIDPSGNRNRERTLPDVPEDKPADKPKDPRGGGSGATTAHRTPGVVPKGSGPEPNTPAAYDTPDNGTRGYRKRGDPGQAGTVKAGEKIKQERRDRRTDKANSTSRTETENNGPNGQTSPGPKSRERNRKIAERENTVAGRVYNDVTGANRPRANHGVPKGDAPRAKGSAPRTDKGPAPEKKDPKTYTRPGRPGGGNAEQTRTSRPSKSETGSRTRESRTDAAANKTPTVKQKIDNNKRQRTQKKTARTKKKTEKKKTRASNKRTRRSRRSRR